MRIHQIKPKFLTLQNIRNRNQIKTRNDISTIENFKTVEITEDEMRSYRSKIAKKASKLRDIFG